MRKITFLIVSIFLICNVVFSQENGVVSYTITYNWVQQYASCTYMPKTERERLSYVYASNSTWDAKAELKFNATISRYEGKEDEDAQKWRKEPDYIIYRDLAAGKTFDVMTLLNKEYVIQDSISCQNWKIKNDMKEIAGRICMNATCYDSLKMKEIVAWFALDLPISIGPDKYCGLPGMILEVNEANGALVYTATSILFSEEKIEIEKPVVKKKVKTIDYIEYDKIVGKYIDDCKKMQRPYFSWGSGISF